MVKLKRTIGAMSSFGIGYPGIADRAGILI